MQSELTYSTMKNGLILGVILSISFLFSVTKNPYLGHLTNLLFFLAIYLSYKYAVKFRDSQKDKSMSYFQAFSYVVLSFIFAGIIASMVSYVYVRFINPEFLAGIMNDPVALQTLDAYEAKFPGIKDKVIAEMNQVITPTAFAFSLIWFQAIVGSFVGLIMAAFVKRNKENISDK